MASGTDSPSGLDATSSLELALDQAIAKCFAGAPERAAKKRRNTPVQNFAVGASEQAHTPTENLRGASSTALAVPSRETALMRPPPRLRWRGIEVSDEFQEYAARVARGEELEPYRGAVLSRPCPEFPWGAVRERQTLLPPARPSLPPVSVSIAPPPPRSEPTVYPERGRALKTALWLAGAVSSIIGALGVGAGATSTAGNDFDDLAPDPNELTRKPSPAATAARADGSASNLDAAPELDQSLRERQLASLAADNAGAAANAKPIAPGPVRSLTPRTFPAPLAAPRQPSAAANGPGSVRASSAPPSSAQRLTIPSPASLPAGELPRGIVTMARPAERSDGVASSDDSTLFSERAPF
jgi:hypothetical protein